MNYVWTCQWTRQLGHAYNTSVQTLGDLPGEIHDKDGW